jgi:hypothetical protein
MLEYLIQNSILVTIIIVKGSDPETYKGTIKAYEKDMCLIHFVGVAGSIYFFPLTSVAEIKVV